eukprot:4462627-Alexandrium_andersonii.AAC.1
MSRFSNVCPVGQHMLRIEAGLGIVLARATPATDEQDVQMKRNKNRGARDALLVQSTPLLG